LDDDAHVADGDLGSPRLVSGSPRTPADAGCAVTIVTPCYNDGEFLLDAVASVARHAPRCEHLIVDDGSTEKATLALLAELKLRGHRVLDRPHGGLAAARNAGVAEAKGRYILPLDADDILEAGFVNEATELLDANDDLAVVYGDRLEFGLRDRRVSTPEFSLAEMLLGNVIPATALVRKRAWTECGGQDPRLPGWEDWDFWITLAEKGWKFRHLPAVAFRYRVRADSLSARLRDPAVGPQLQRYIVEKHVATATAHLPELQIAAQEARRASEARHLEAHRLAGRERELAVENASLRSTNEALGERLEQGQSVIAELYEELARWRRRVIAMESTRAWRWRELLLRARRRLRG
jgi:hypothetical protein